MVIVVRAREDDDDDDDGHVAYAFGEARDRHTHNTTVEDDEIDAFSFVSHHFVHLLRCLWCLWLLIRSRCEVNRSSI